MAQVRNIAPQERTIPALGIQVDVDEVFTVPDDFFEAHAWPEGLYEVISTPTKKKDKE